MAFNPKGPQPPQTNPYADYRDPAHYTGPMRSGFEHTQAHEAEHISGDGGGTDPNASILVETGRRNPDGSPEQVTFRYLSEADVDTLNAFRHVADAMDWAGADVVSLRTHRDPMARIWTNPNRTGMTALRRIARTRKGEEHNAYFIGHLGSPDLRQAVYFCDDGLLRSRRSYELQQSYGTGLGVLPSLEVLRRTLAIGTTHGVDYSNFGSLTLAQLLLKKIPDGTQKTRLVRQYGLAA